MYKVCLQVPARFTPGPGVRRTQHNDFIMTGTLMPDPYGPAFCSATVDHWLHLLTICFTHHSDKRDIDELHHLRTNVLCI